MDEGCLLSLSNAAWSPFHLAFRQATRKTQKRGSGLTPLAPETFWGNNVIDFTTSILFSSFILCASLLCASRRQPHQNRNCAHALRRMLAAMFLAWCVVASGFANATTDDVYNQPARESKRKQTKHKIQHFLPFGLGGLCSKKLRRTTTTTTTVGFFLRFFLLRHPIPPHPNILKHKKLTIL